MSIAFSLDSLGPGASVPEQVEQPSTSDTEDVQTHLPSSPQPDEDSYSSTLQTTLQQQRGSSLTSSQNTIQLGGRFGSDASLSTEGRGSDSSNPKKEFTDPSRPMLEMCNLLTQAENGLSAGSHVASSVTSHSLSDIVLSPRSKKVELQEPSFSSSATEDPRSQSSQLWGRSLSDSMLTSENTVEPESMTSSKTPDYPSATTSYRRQEDGTADDGTAPSFVLSQSVRRTEPEGCSSAPPDSTVPPQPPPSIPSASAPQQLPPPSDTEEEEKQATVEGPEQDTATSPSEDDHDQGVMSDGSSRSSLAAKVTHLLQTESPATVVSSSSSMTDREERRARGTHSRFRLLIHLSLIWVGPNTCVI